MKEQPDYLSYLLRLWRANSGPAEPHGRGRPLWRASLEDPRSGERLGFGSPVELFRFLEEAMGCVHRQRHDDLDAEQKEVTTTSENPVSIENRKSKICK
jgi:hypothetical protein